MKIPQERIVGNRFNQSGRHWSKAGANAMLAVRCCLEINREPEIIDWGNAARSRMTKKFGMRPTRSSRSPATGFHRFAAKSESQRYLNPDTGIAKSNPFVLVSGIGSC